MKQVQSRGKAGKLYKARNIHSPLLSVCAPFVTLAWSCSGTDGETGAVEGKGRKLYKARNIHYPMLSVCTPFVTLAWSCSGTDGETGAVEGKGRKTIQSSKHTLPDVERRNIHSPLLSVCAPFVTLAWSCSVTSGETGAVEGKGRKLS